MHPGSAADKVRELASSAAPAPSLKTTLIFRISAIRAAGLRPLLLLDRLSFPRLLCLGSRVRRAVWQFCVAIWMASAVTLIRSRGVQHKSPTGHGAAVAGGVAPEHQQAAGLHEGNFKFEAPF